MIAVKVGKEKLSVRNEQRVLRKGVEHMQWLNIRVRIFLNWLIYQIPGNC